VVGPVQDNYQALKEICERHKVRRLDLHGSSSMTGEDTPDGKAELNLLVEWQPMPEMERIDMRFALEEALGKFFGREVGLVTIDRIKIEYVQNVFKRRRTLLYSCDDAEEA